MCGRTALYLDAEYITERLEIPNWIDKDKYQKSYNVSPSYYQPVITRGLGNNPSQSDKNTYQQPGNPKLIRSMKWGLIPSWAANNPKTGGKIQPINIRDDSIIGNNPKQMFKNIRNTQRCLVIAQGFYEWKKEGKTKAPYFITPSDQENKDVPFVLLGALYDRVLIAGYQIYSYAIITTPANDQFKIADRMPLVFNPELDKEAIEYWLDPRVPINDRIKEILTPFSRKLTIYRVPDSVNKTEVSHPSMMLPINAKSTLLGFVQKTKPSTKSLEDAKPIKSDIKVKEDSEIKKETEVVEIKDESSDDEDIEIKLGKRVISSNPSIDEKRKIKKEI